MDRYLATLDHEEILIRRGTRSGLYSIVAVHSTARGPSLGGCRLWAYGDSRAAVRDAMRLAEGMTYKAAVANLAQGGGKGVIMAPMGERLEGDLRRAALLDFARRGQPRRGPLHHGRGRRHLPRRRRGDGRGHAARQRAAARARRLRRSEPVDRARRRGLDPRRVRARLRDRGHGRPVRLDHRPRPRRRPPGPAAGRGRRAARRHRRRPEQAHAGARAGRGVGRAAGRALRRRRRASPRAPWAGRWTTTPCRG